MITNVRLELINNGIVVYQFRSTEISQSLDKLVMQSNGSTLPAVAGIWKMDVVGPFTAVTIKWKRQGQYMSKYDRTSFNFQI